jgi:uncharacterized damage-inducible protein DinB
MAHPLVEQLRFTRSEFQRALAGVSDEDASRRMLPMNSISWTVGHLAWQEQRYWLMGIQRKVLLPELYEQFGWGRPATTPALSAVWPMWHAIIEAADPFLDTLTDELLTSEVAFPDIGWKTSAGNLMQRVIYHYWYHAGECMAIRQMLGHASLPEFVGDIDTEAPYRLS